MEQLKDINYVERRDFLLARRELNKKKRLESKSKRLFVSLMGYKSHYEDMVL